MSVSYSSPKINLFAFIYEMPGFVWFSLFVGFVLFFAEQLYSLDKNFVIQLAILSIYS